MKKVNLIVVIFIVSTFPLGLHFKFIAQKGVKWWVYVLCNFSHFDISHALENILLIPVVIFYSLNYKTTKKYNLLPVMLFAIITSTITMYISVNNNNIQTAGMSGVALFIITFYTLIDIIHNKLKSSVFTFALLALIIFEYLTNIFGYETVNINILVHQTNIIGGGILAVLYSILFH